ncbi:MAG: hypothetical protein M3121_08180 [Chloroflexota bacterium]|nr:hypothetical protein [Chloroflexota bacterium]
MIFGAIVGALIGVIGQALSGGQRDLSSVSGMSDAEVAAEAERLLSGMPQPAT